ncbi:MAG: metallophosphoesterase, partial [Candidatus Methanomethyliaceae archaeon]|nr:metallophosphoesterase [Candidatus Methanomethyliaceae archaeon]
MKELITDIEKLLKKEQKFIEIENLPVVIIGDIHGDYLSLESILNNLKDEIIVFLGDYADRGPSPIEVYERIFKLKLFHPERIFILRGNHEAPNLFPFHPHDLPWHLKYKYGDSWKELYQSLLKVYNEMPIAAIVKEFALLLHGGISPKIGIESLRSP